MADLTWPGDILILAGISTVALILLGYLASYLMVKKGITLQVKPKRKKAKSAKAKKA